MHSHIQQELYVNYSIGIELAGISTDDLLHDRELLPARYGHFTRLASDDLHITLVRGSDLSLLFNTSLIFSPFNECLKKTLRSITMRLDF